MKKLFAILLSAALLLVGSNMKAQVVAGAGYLLSLENTVSANNGDKVDNTALHGVFFGASYNIGIIGGFGVAPGLYGSVSTSNVAAGSGNNVAQLNVTGRYREFALNMPINLTYKFDINDRIAFFAFAGPVLQCGLVSKTTVRGEAGVNLFGKKFLLADNEKYDHYNAENGNRNRFNLYLGGGVGVQIGDIQIHVGYDRSMLDIDKVDGFRTYRNQVKIGINFEF